jgi:serine/threonine protein kinase
MAMAGSKGGRVTHLAPMVNTELNKNSDLGQRQVSGSPETVGKYKIFPPLSSESNLLFSTNTFVALKILTGAATQLNREHKLRELEALNLLKSGDLAHVVRLSDYFYHTGIEEDGEHLCMVTELQHSTVQSIRQSIPDGFIPVQVSKRILLHTLRGLAAMHPFRIAHTGKYALLLVL